MKRTLRFTVLFGALAIAACGASSPEQQVERIDEMLGKGLPMTAEQTREVNQFVENGKRLLSDGKTAEASAAFDRALDILQMAADADAFNKAE